MKKNKVLKTSKKTFEKSVWIFIGTGILSLIIVIGMIFLIKIDIGSYQKVEPGVDLEEPYIQPVKILTEALETYDKQKAETAWLPFSVEQGAFNYGMGYGFEKEVSKTKRINIVSSEQVPTDVLDIDFPGLSQDGFKEYFQEITDLYRVGIEWDWTLLNQERNKNVKETVILYSGKWHDQWYLILQNEVSRKIT